MELIKNHNTKFFNKQMTKNLLHYVCLWNSKLPTLCLRAKSVSIYFQLDTFYTRCFI